MIDPFWDCYFVWLFDVNYWSKSKESDLFNLHMWFVESDDDILQSQIPMHRSNFCDSFEQTADLGYDESKVGLADPLALLILPIKYFIEKGMLQFVIFDCGAVIEGEFPE